MSSIPEQFINLNANLTSVYSPLPHINSQTVECNPVELTNWLNQLVDRINDHSYRIIEIVNAVQELQEAVICLDEEIQLLKVRVDALEQWRIIVDQTLDSLQQQINNIQQQIDIINQEIAQINQTLADHSSRIISLESDMAWFYSKLPRSKESLPSDFRFGMGNINVMSANGGSASTAIGIFTSSGIENNDIYFY